jgi:hypothetical protein
MGLTEADLEEERSGWTWMFTAKRPHPWKPENNPSKIGLPYQEKESRPGR